MESMKHRRLGAVESGRCMDEWRRSQVSVEETSSNAYGVHLQERACNEVFTYLEGLEKKGFIDEVFTYLEGMQ